MCLAMVMRVRQLLAGVLLELFRDAHVRRALERLRIDDVSDDRLVFASQIFIQEINEGLARNRCICHLGISLPQRV